MLVPSSNVLSAPSSRHSSIARSRHSLVASFDGPLLNDIAGIEVDDEADASYKGIMGIHSKSSGRTTQTSGGSIY